MEVLDLLILLALTAINFWIGYKVAYKVYNILISKKTFDSRVEKVGFYVHGWLAYAAHMALIVLPMITLSWKHGIIGTGFLILQRILLKGKV